ncbi:MAG: AsmA family protein [Bacteroidaceae bacterium]|nr:AsmA family protein [Bacteroidaceae bacterium]
MKKGLKISGIVLIGLLALMVILPMAFKGKIKEIVIEEGNKMLNAEFGFDDLDISLFREFPQASVRLENFWLKGIEHFENDTLLQAGEMEVAVNVMSIFGDSGFDISKVLLTDIYAKAIVSEDGQVNWNVMKTDSTAIEETTTDTTATTFRIKLKEVELENINLLYDDRQSNMMADIKQLNATCSGDMSADNTLLNLETVIHSLTYKMSGIPFLNQARIEADMNIEADLKNNKFTLQENKLALNAIQTTIDGWLALATDNSMNMDLKLNTSDINFKEILSLIPAIYTKDFEELKADGTVSLKAFAKGEMKGDSILPQFEANLQVKDGAFQYPTLPAGVNQIQISADVKNPGGNTDLTEINVSQFIFNILGNQFGATAQIKTPISDPDFQFSADGILDLGQIKNVYPLEEMSLNGVLTADMSLSGKLSYLDKEMYDKFAASGNINLKEMLLKMKEMPDVSIKQSTFTFSPQYLNLSQTTVFIGENDITADCRFENYMAFALKGKTLKGKVNVQSNHFNLNDFMTAEGDTVMAAADTTTTANEAGGVLIVPENIDFDMNADMKEILFDKIIINDLNGKLIVKDGTVDMKNLSMNTMGGKVVMNGAYSTAQSISNPTLNASFAMNNLSFSQTFKELDMIQKLAPVFENLKGNFSGKISIDTKLDSIMSPVLNTMQGNGSLSTSNINLSGITIFDKIADATNYDGLKNLSVKDMNIDFTIQNGRLTTTPFDIKMGNLSLNLSGSTGLDQTIDYKGKLKLPETTGSIGNLTTLDLKIGGNFTSPQISIDTQSMAKQAVTNVANEALKAAGDKLGIDISDAEKQKEALVNAAKQTAEKLLAEAEKQKAALIEKAGNNAIKRIAAEKTGEAIVNEAKKQTERMIQEAEEQGNKLIEKAKKGETE